MSFEYLALLMISVGWLMMFFLEKKKGIIPNEVFKVLCALSFTLNIMGSFMCIIGLTDGI